MSVCCSFLHSSNPIAYDSKVTYLQVQEDVANDNGSSTAVVKEEKNEEKIEVKTEAACLQRANSISPLGSPQWSISPLGSQQWSIWFETEFKTYTITSIYPTPS